MTDTAQKPRLKWEHEEGSGFWEVYDSTFPDSTFLICMTVAARHDDETGSGPVWSVGEEKWTRAETVLAAQLAAEQRARELLREAMEMLGEEQVNG